MKLLIPILLIAFFSQCSSSNKTQNTNQTSESMTNFYDLSIPALNETDTIHFSDFKGKKVLLVNVASKCGYTPQYEGLQKLYTEYGDKLIVIGFPCNQFLYQEPGSSEEIADFCSTEYGVSFPLSTKIKVKGDSAHPVYQWLTQKELNRVGDYKISWNFNKFLVDENGKLQAYFETKVKPYDQEVLNAINQ